MDLHAYAQRDALGLAELIRSRQVSADEAHDAARRALEAVNPQLNGLVGPIFERPLDYDAGGPFAGVPFLIKDIAVTATGVPTAMGSRLAEGCVAPSESDLMARFRAGGLATLGRTALPEFGFNATTEPVANGPTRNPYDVSRSTGGSSGGSAALVAAGAVPIAHANDAGGSIRIPAACCGLVGLKPTRGRNPIGPAVGEAIGGLGVELVVTRTVRDTAAALDVTRGAGVGERYVIAPPERPYPDEVGAPQAPVRVALATAAASGTRVDPLCVAAAEATARTLEELGHAVEPGAPDVDSEAVHAANKTIWSTSLASLVGYLAPAVGREPSPETCETMSLVCLEHARSLTALDVLAAQDTVNVVCRGVGAFFERYDLLVTPVLATPPAPLGQLDYDDPSQTVESWTRKLFEYAPFTALFNLAGQPAISLPLAMSPDGLPLGVQLVARYGNEALLLRVAGQLEQARPWSGHPAVAVQ